jgi:hypothetical protein
MMAATSTTIETLEDPRNILELLRVQARLYARLESFASRQRTLVTGDDVGPLLSLLADRQRLSEQMAHLGEALKPIRRDWQAYREALAPPDRSEADRLLGETEERLKRMIESDEHDARVLSVRKQAVARTLRATHASGQAVSAYRSPTNHSGRLDCVDGDSS